MTKQWKPLTAPAARRLPVGCNRSGDPVRLCLMAPATRLQRKRRHDLRKILYCILWLLRTGSQWRNIHPDWLPWQAIYYYFNQWKAANLFEHINATLNQLDRQQQGRAALPSVLCIDKQSVKLSPVICEHRGMDAHKLVNAGPPVRPQAHVCCRYPGTLMGSRCRHG